MLSPCFVRTCCATAVRSRSQNTPGGSSAVYGPMPSAARACTRPTFPSWRSGFGGRNRRAGELHLGPARNGRCQYVAGLIAGIVILVLVLVIWGHGIKWLSDTWGGSDAALVGAVLLGIVFVPVFFIIGLVTEVRHVVNRSASAR